MRKIKTILANRRAYIKRYLWPLPKFRREFVVMVDGKMTHGGLTDRIRNILSVYCFCKEHKIPFRIFYIYPIRLEEFLIPNEYDWRITEDEVSYHFMDSEEVALYVQELPGAGQWPSGKARTYNNTNHISVLEQINKTKKAIQYHIYGNAYFARGHYSLLFNELFRPSSYLNCRLTELKKALREPFESVTLRFQMLLGDLDEGRYDVLNEFEREALIKKCIDKIEDLWQSQYFSTPKVLVTSDSMLFLSRIAAKSYVYTIPGKMEHMDYTNNTDLEMNAKPFLDLFLLMESRRLTLLITGKMYKSGFPSFAAELGGKPYNEVYWE